MATGTCDSCGDTDDRLIAVNRLYVTPAAWDTEERIEVVPDLEHWCLVCCTHYPHQTVNP